MAGQAGGHEGEEGHEEVPWWQIGRPVREGFLSPAFTASKVVIGLKLKGHRGLDR
jgi:hypothetical protein